MISVAQLTKRFAAKVAVDQLSFELTAGEVLGFLGPNGAGKSTTMKMIAGCLQPTAGRVEVAGFDVQRQGLAARQQLGYLPEGAPAYGDMTVLAFLSFIAQVRGFYGQALKNSVREVCQRVGLLDVVRQPIMTLSKGYKRRVGLAQALIHDPKVLILDEPTDGLDPNQKQQVRSLIADLAEDKLVIVSTHILEEVSAVCSRAMIIAEGRMVVDETPAQLEARSRYHQAVSLQFTEFQPQASAQLQQWLAQSGSAAELEVEREGWVYRIFPDVDANQNLYGQIYQLSELHRWPLQSLLIERGRLDDVFQQLTQPQMIEMAI